MIILLIGVVAGVSAQLNHYLPPHQDSQSVQSPPPSYIPPAQSHSNPAPVAFNPPVFDIPAPAPAPQHYSAPAQQQYLAPAPQQYSAPAPQRYSAPAPAPQQYSAPAAQQYSAPAPSQSYDDVNGYNYKVPNQAF